MKAPTHIGVATMFAIASQTLTACATPPAPPPDIGNRVREVFAAKCIGCHGADLVNPRGRFNYVLDFHRVARNPEMVIPGELAESELWSLVDHNEMPPSDSPRGQLTPEQKEIIKQWIVAGAPNAPPVVPEKPAELPTQTPPSPVAAGRLFRWIGKLHLVILHFPIALVVAALVAEAGSSWRRHPRPSGSTHFCLRLAALAVIPTAALGWLLAAGTSASSSPLLTAHRWLGTATALSIVVTAAYAHYRPRQTNRSRLQLLLITTFLLTAITAHLGGLITHGTDFFNY